ncbi:MAG: CoA-binding protein [Thermodesulfobacteriota bacterium]|jgi:predicted CoA-binding protein|nr:MAG: CoA-binding protein [Thermodesulfobacteriota bacterium]
MENNDRIPEIFENCHTIAVYGMSKNPKKAAHRVPAFLLAKGYAIIPVNPSADMILNRRCYHNLKEVEERIDIIEVFRPSEEALSIVQEAIQRKKEKGDIGVIWLQEGIQNEEAKMLAEKNGIIFIQDHCMFKEYSRLFPES